MNQSPDYKVLKKDLIKTQIDQIRLIKKHLNEIKNLTYVFENMKIYESQEEFNFTFGQFEFDDRSMHEFEFYQNQNDQNTINEKLVMIGYVINLYVFFGQLGIHLPMLCQHDLQRQIDAVENLSGYDLANYFILRFGNQLLSKDNIQLIRNNSIPYEIIQSILDGENENIVYNEKMSVFSLGCMIYNLSQKQDLFIQDSNNLLDQRTKNWIDNISQEVKLVIEKCVDEEPNNRPDLKDVKEEFWKLNFKILLLNSEKLRINYLTNLLISPNDQITGRLLIMEFFAKVKFIVKIFNKFHLQDEKKQEIILELTCQELDKLVLQDGELIKWQTEKKTITKDEIDEFKNKYLTIYQGILDSIKKEIQGKIQKDIYQEIIDKRVKTLEVKIPFLIQAINNSNIGTRQMIAECLREFQKNFQYEELSTQFNQQQRQKISEAKPYDRYDEKIDILFNE